MYAIRSYYDTIVFFGEEWCLKIFRQAEDGPNPDVEIVRYLREKAGYDRTPAIAGSLLYRQPGHEEAVTVITSYSIHYTKLYDRMR